MKFKGKYKQEHIDDEEIIRANYDNDIIKEMDGEEFLGSFQLLIFYFNNKDFDTKDIIETILDNIPEYVNICDNCRSFFIGNKYQISHIMDIYLIFEDIFFDKINLDLAKEFKAKLDLETDEIKLPIEDPNEKIKLNKFLLCCRRFITRYLKSQFYKQKSNLDLIPELVKTNLWEEKPDDLKNLLKKRIGSCEIKIGQAYELCKLIKDKQKQEDNSEKKKTRRRGKARRRE